MAAWPVDIEPLGAVACGATLWRMRGELHVTVIVKATFDLVHESVATLGAPDPLAKKDQHHDKNPTRSVLRASDLAPYRPRADVTFVGHACAPRPVTSAAVRIAVFRERALLDKTVHVYGDRGSSSAAPSPFQRIPLVYERASGGPAVDHNPVGIGARPTGAQPNLVPARAGSAPAGFGPISRYWPARKQLLGAAYRKGIEARIAQIPDDVSWDYFQAAPPDQQVEFLRGDEWIVLDGLHPSLPRVQTRLPGAQGAAMVHAARGEGWSEGQEIALAADTLEIDGDRQRCSLVWRGSFVVPGGESGLASLKVFGGVELPNAIVRWPDLDRHGRLIPAAQRSGLRSRPLEPEPDTETLRIGDGGTITLSPEQGAAAASRPAAPFVESRTDPLGMTVNLPGDAPGQGSRAALPPALAVRPSDIPGAPWATSAAKRPPAPLGDDYATTIFVDLPLPAPPPTLARARAPFPPLEPEDPEEATTLHQARPSGSAHTPGSVGTPHTPGSVGTPHSPGPSKPEPEIEEIDPGEPEPEGRG